MTMPKVWNKRKPYPAGAIYIGRPSRYGNPYSHLEGTLAQFKVNTRKDAVEQFEIWFLKQPELIARAKRELAGKDLVCWCHPLPCHGHVIFRIVNGYDADEAIKSPAQELLF